MAELLDQMPEKISVPRPGSVVKGTIILVGEDKLCVNIGCKNDGIVPRSEISAEPNLELAKMFADGQEVEVYVVSKDDGDGNILLSLKRVSLDKDWEELKKIKESGEEIVVKVVDVAKNGVNALYNDIKGFIPASQLAVKYTKNLKPFVGKELRVIVEEADRSKKRAIFSHKPIAVREHEEKEEEFWGRISNGIILKGGVKRITDFGIFVDIGGKDGLVHNSEISWGGRPRLQSDMVKVGDIIDVKVLDANREKDRVSLSIKRVTPEPWSDFEHRYYVDYIYRGKVVNMTDFGAFIELEPGVEGLVHISHITRQHIKHPSDVLELGQVVEVKILEYSLPDKRVKLSIKAVEEEDAYNEEEQAEEE
ncbi:MAG: S1 RNA-binding domain-containing protein [Bacillota bacterium]|nr:S1 RNA-binding domain-containing protein [Bacillota bacterium]